MGKQLIRLIAAGVALWVAACTAPVVGPPGQVDPATVNPITGTRGSGR
jgi:hypothetical protein